MISKILKEAHWISKQAAERISIGKWHKGMVKIELPLEIRNDEDVLEYLLKNGIEQTSTGNLVSKLSKEEVRAILKKIPRPSKATIAKKDGKYKNFTGTINAYLILTRVENATFEIEGRKIKTWYDGTVLEGDFECKLWKNGTILNSGAEIDVWENGKVKADRFTIKVKEWKNGIFEGGVFSGKWTNGVFKKGTFNGTFAGGNFQGGYFSLNTAEWSGGVWGNEAKVYDGNRKESFLKDKEETIEQCLERLRSKKVEINSWEKTEKLRPYYTYFEQILNAYRYSKITREQFIERWEKLKDIAEANAKKTSFDLLKNLPKNIILKDEMLKILDETKQIENHGTAIDNFNQNLDLALALS